MGEGKKRKLVVVQLSGGNDYLNCVIPYSDSRYVDSRPNVRITEDGVIPLDDRVGLNPGMQPIKELYDEGKVAIVHGTGYPNPNRSHFRSMDIWHTARARQARRGGVARQRHKTDAPGRRQRGGGRQLRRRAPQGPCGEGRPRRVGNQPRDLWPDEPHRRHATNATRPSTPSKACTPRRSELAR